ncbi:MAG: hypothetical protein KGL39_01515 [Patescibacteria group bacterium]|nr:hypothetical protein [Patescibacteria group bacterium]
MPFFAMNKVLFALGVVLVLVAATLVMWKWNMSDKVWTSSTPDAPPGLTGESSMTLADAKRKCLANSACGGFRRKWIPAANDAPATAGYTQFFGKKVGRETPNDDWTSWYRPGVWPKR